MQMCSSEDLDALEGVANGKLSNGSPSLKLALSFEIPQYRKLVYDPSMVRIVQSPEVRFRSKASRLMSGPVEIVDEPSLREVYYLDDRIVEGGRIGRIHENPLSGWPNRIPKT